MLQEIPKKYTIKNHSVWLGLKFQHFSAGHCHKGLYEQAWKDL